MNFALWRNYIYTRKALQYYSITVFKKLREWFYSVFFRFLAYKQQKNSFSKTVIL